MIHLLQRCLGTQQARHYCNVAMLGSDMQATFAILPKHLVGMIGWLVRSVVRVPDSWQSSVIRQQPTIAPTQDRHLRSGEASRHWPCYWSSQFQGIWSICAFGSNDAKADKNEQQRAQAIMTSKEKGRQISLDSC
jgi:hypothetical protein